MNEEEKSDSEKSDWASEPAYFDEQRDPNNRVMTLKRQLFPYIWSEEQFINTHQRQEFLKHALEPYSRSRNGRRILWKLAQKLLWTFRSITRGIEYANSHKNENPFRSMEYLLDHPQSTTPTFQVLKYIRTLLNEKPVKAAGDEDSGDEGSEQDRDQTGQHSHRSQAEMLEVEIFGPLFEEENERLRNHQELQRDKKGLSKEQKEYVWKMLDPFSRSRNGRKTLWNLKRLIIEGATFNRNFFLLLDEIDVLDIIESLLKMNPRRKVTFIPRYTVDTSGIFALDDIPDTIEEFLDTYATWEIKSIRVYREQIVGAIKLVAQTIMGKKQKLPKHTYHAFQVLRITPLGGTLKQQKLVRIDKDENVKMVIIKTMPKGEYKTIQNASLRNLTLEEYIDNAHTFFEQQKKGHFWQYAAADSNCQYFVYWCLKGNNLITPALENFFFQPDIILPAHAKKVFNTITGLAAIASRAVHKLKKKISKASKAPTLKKGKLQHKKAKLKLAAKRITDRTRAHGCIMCTGEMDECPICYDPFTGEKINPQKPFKCEHLLCNSCLESLMDTGRTVRCPLCRAYPEGITAPRERELPPQRIRNQLPEQLWTPQNRQFMGERIRGHMNEVINRLNVLPGNHYFPQINRRREFHPINTQMSSWENEEDWNT